MALKAPTLPKELQDKSYTVADETLKVKVSGGRANHDIEIGDAKEPGQYIPQSKHLYFDNEANVSFRPKLFNPSVGSVVVEDGVIKYITDDWEHHMYENEGEVFGFEHDFVLKQKPADLTQDYQVLYTIRTKGLKFYKQLPLTQDEIDEGCIRPENVVNSYAVYIDGKKGNYTGEGGKFYATGKVGHLYRVKAIDANGDWTWCDQDFDEKKNEYIQTVPKEFLETAAYPVRVDPQLGYTTGGATHQYIADYNNYGSGKNETRIGQVLAGVNGYISNITCYFNNDGGVAQSSVNYKAFINQVDSVATNSHGELKAVTKTGFNLGTSTKKWDTVSFEPITVSTGTNYILSVVGDSDSLADYGNICLMYDSTGSLDYFNESGLSYDSPEAPWTTASPSNGVSYSIFATYSTSANTYVIYPYNNGYLRVDHGSSSTDTFADLRDDTTANYISTTGNTSPAAIRSSNQTDGWYQLYRTFIGVDTSILDGKTLVSATYNFVSPAVYANGTEDDGNIHMVPASPASETTYADTDFGNVTFTDHGGMNREDVTGDNATINTLTLNSTHLSYVNKTGNTMLAMITEADLNNSATWYATALNGVNFYNIYRADTNRWNYFTYTFSAGGGGGSTFVPRVMFY